MDIKVIHTAAPWEVPQKVDPLSRRRVSTFFPNYFTILRSLMRAYGQLFVLFIVVWRGFSRKNEKPFSLTEVLKVLSALPVALACWLYTNCPPQGVFWTSWSKVVEASAYFIGFQSVTAHCFTFVTSVYSYSTRGIIVDHCIWRSYRERILRKTSH